MCSCKESIQEYLFCQEKIKENMQKLKNECPDKVINFLLKKESKTTYEKVINCTWADIIDKKYLLKLIKTKCEDL